MKLIIENLGKINKSEIDFKDFTLIVGDNSLGKTFLLEAYALYNNLVIEKAKAFRECDFINKVEIEGLDTIFNELGVYNFDEWNSNDTEKVLPIKFTLGDRKILNSYLEQFKNEYSLILKERILQDHNSKVKVDIKFKKVNEENLPKKINISYDKLFLKVNFQYMEYKSRMKLPLSLIAESKNLIPTIKTHIKLSLKEFLSTIYIYDVCDKKEILFFPSERNLYTANALRKSAQYMKDTFTQLDNEETMRYSENLFISSYLKYIDWLGMREKLNGTIFEENLLYKKLCDMMGGKPIFKDGMIDYLDTETEKISKNLLSTKQNRLLPYFMLCSLKEKKTIIIEEPEAHMSLKSMFELVSLLQILIKDNHQLILTTHSDVFASLVNNFLKTNTEKKINQSIYELLEYKNNESILKELENKAFGYEFSFMTDYLEKLNQETRLAFKDDYYEHFEM